MICPQCRTECAPDSAFCPRCGALVQRACPQCACQVPAEFTFCPRCGSAVQAGSAEAVQQQSAAALLQAAQRLIPKEFAERLRATRGQVASERRMITILFCDVKGSTTIAENMDPEDVMDVMSGAFEFLIAPIYRHEGTLARLMGDAVLAFFGAPIAHEDDPERAIRAGLEITAEAAEYAEKLKTERGIQGFNVRVGINTGLVVVGEVGADLRVEYTAMGDAVNLAARLEQIAPPGGVLISGDTYRHVRGVFDVQALEPAAVKGRTQPVPVYLVQRAKPRAFRLETRGVAGVETRMIGRDAELKQLQDAYLLASEDRDRQMVTVHGEPGVGKSRLLHEFQAWAELRPETIRLFVGRAAQQSQHLPYALMRDLFTFRFQILDSDPVDSVRRKMEAGMAEVMGDDPQVEAKAHLLGQLLGFGFSASPHVAPVLADPVQLHDRGLLYLTQFVAATTSRLPTLVLLEDLHWGDDPSLDAIQHLAQQSAGQRLIIVCAARPDLFERRPHWGEGWAFHNRLVVKPLSKIDARRMVAEVLKKTDTVPTELRDLVVNGAEGNPFYVEELIKMLLEDGVIAQAADAQGRWRVEAARLAQLRVPSTLTAVLQARLDRLPQEERAVLQWASIVGRTFWSDTLQRIAASAAPQQVRLEDALSALHGREMIYRRESSAFGDTHEYVFRHTLLHDVTYEGVLKKVRRMYHGIVADWLIEKSRDRAAEYAGLIAAHLERAGRAAEALPHLKLAGEQAAARYANSEAVDFLTRALQLVPESDLALRFDLTLAREQVHGLQGARDPQRQDLQALQELAQALNDDRRRARAAVRLAGTLADSGDPVGAASTAQSAIRWAKAAHDASLEAEGHWYWGRALWRQGQYLAARSQYEQALNVARSALAAGEEAQRRTLRSVPEAERRGLRRLEANALRGLGVVTGELEDPMRPRVYWEQCLGIYREIGDRLGEARILNNLGTVANSRAELGVALVYWDQARQAARDLGDRGLEAVVMSNLSQLWNACGDYARAADCIQQALAIARQTEFRPGEAGALDYFAMTHHNQGRHAAALELAQQALQIAQEGGHRREEGYAWKNLGLALEGLRRWREAADAHRRSAALRRDLGATLQATEPLAGQARACLELGDLAQALALAEEMLPDLDQALYADLDEPLLAAWTCYRVLIASNDPRAMGVLDLAHRLLESWSATLPGPMRRSFLENVAWHRAIAEEYAKLSKQAGLDE